MPRKLRIEFADATYHVTNRGDRGETIFKGDADRENFIATLGEAAIKSSWSVHAFCLLPNHFHLVVQTPQPSLVAGMKWFLGTYTNRFNRRHGQRGHLFAGRYRALPIDPAADWFLRACDHVHLNPARLDLLTDGQRLADYPWSSYPHYLGQLEQQPAWLRFDRLLEACGFDSSSADRSGFEQRTEAKRSTDGVEDWAGVRRGWCFGGEGFREQLALGLAVGKAIVRHGKEPVELTELCADQIVAEELAALGWTESDLARHRKTAPQKVQIARRLRRDTVLSLRWIAARLHMGSMNTLRNALLATVPAPQAKVSAHAREAIAALPPPDPKSGGTPDSLVLPPDSSSVSSSAPFDVVWD